jgi:hypothetical protein
MTGYTTSSITDVWDFGSPLAAQGYVSGKRLKGHNSYSYQLPLPLQTGQVIYPITTTSNPAKAVLADRSPYWQDVTETSFYLYNYSCSGSTVMIKSDSVPYANNTYHQKDGQNVLYADQHSKFEKQANCGAELDNIYTTWGTSTITSSCGSGAGGEQARQCGYNAGTTGGPQGTAVTKTTVQTPSTNFWRPLNDGDNYLVSDIDKAP